MGCNIHAYIDYEQPDGTVNHFGRVHIARDYRLFVLFAGVRGSAVQGMMPVTQKRGLPANISVQVAHDAYLTVIDEEVVREHRCCSRKDAEEWGAKYVDEAKRHIHNPDWHSHTWLTLEEVEEVITRYSTLKENHRIYLKDHEEVPKGYELEEDRWAGMRVAFCASCPVATPVELLAVRAAMCELAQKKCKPKLIVWFDN